MQVLARILGFVNARQAEETKAKTPHKPFFQHLCSDFNSGQFIDSHFGIKLFLEIPDDNPHKLLAVIGTSD